MPELREDERPAVGGSTRDLLAELLVSFGFDPATPPPNLDREPTQSMLGGAPADVAGRSALFARELGEADPLLRELVGETRALRALLGRPQLPTALVIEEYRSRWAAVIERWNAEIYGNEWCELAPLCRVCGVPVLRRGGEMLPEGGIELSTVCSDRCRSVGKQRDYRARQRQSARTR